MCIDREFFTDAMKDKDWRLLWEGKTDLKFVQDYYERKVFVHHWGYHNKIIFMNSSYVYTTCLSF